LIYNKDLLEKDVVPTSPPTSLFLDVLVFCDNNDSRIMKIKIFILKKDKNLPFADIILKNKVSSKYSGIFRFIPFNPTKCNGKNVILTPTKNLQKKTINII
jgi:hypothetical protein